VSLASAREQPRPSCVFRQPMPDNNGQSHVKNVNLIEDATSTRAGVTGFNMHHAFPLGVLLLIGLYALASLFFD
jgi:hypothetical protein